MTRTSAAFQTAIAAAIGWVILVAIVKALGWVFDGDPRVWFVFLTLPPIVFVVAYVVDAVTESRHDD